MSNPNIRKKREREREVRGNQKDLVRYFVGEHGCGGLVSPSVSSHSHSEASFSFAALSTTLNVEDEDLEFTFHIGIGAQTVFLAHKEMKRGELRWHGGWRNGGRSTC